MFCSEYQPHLPYEFGRKRTYLSQYSIDMVLSRYLKRSSIFMCARLLHAQNFISLNGRDSLYYGGCKANNSNYGEQKSELAQHAGLVKPSSMRPRWNKTSSTVQVRPAYNDSLPSASAVQLISCRPASLWFGPFDSSFIYFFYFYFG